MSFGDLVIALAVTWDEPRNANYYKIHAERSGSKVPEELANCSSLVPGMKNLFSVKSTPGFTRNSESRGLR